ncbi:MAG: GNAT family N-acetyltransferase [Candidatus Aureabacteria bacterium]|nr:GNAT family N-acetyltransferase [Candidatus Auribacterota bacterium]
MKHFYAFFCLFCLSVTLFALAPLSNTTKNRVQADNSDEISRIISQLVNEGTISLRAKGDNEEFIFTYEKIDENKYIIRVKNRERVIGYYEVGDSQGMRYSTYPPIDNDYKSALNVAREMRSKYHGIGTTILSMAMHIDKLMYHAKAYTLIATYKSYQFYEKLGFRTYYVEREDDGLGRREAQMIILWYMAFDWVNRPIPKMEISQMTYHKDEIEMAA